jgi:hypothetical protein
MRLQSVPSFEVFRGTSGTLDPHDARQMVSHLALVDQPSGADDVEMKHLVVLELAQDPRRIFTTLHGLDRRQPKFAHLNNAAIRKAKVFCRSISDAALANLRCGILPVDRRHIEF